MKRQRQSKPITRRDARRLAGNYLLTTLLRETTIKDGAKVQWSPVYGARPFNQAAVWLLFLPDKDSHRVLRSSEVVAVCKRTGRVLYHGPANDEG